MNDYNYEVLRAGLNYVLEGLATAPEGTKITARHILMYGKHDLETIKEALAKWERNGDLRIIKPVEGSSGDDFCIEMNRFIEQKSPIKGWLNWE